MSMFMYLYKRVNISVKFQNKYQIFYSIFERFGDKLFVYVKANCDFHYG